jgi:hypothetical protein
MAEVRIEFSTSATGEWSLVTFTVDDDQDSELIDLDYGRNRWRPSLKSLAADRPVYRGHELR